MTFLHEFLPEVERVTAFDVIESRKYIALCEVLERESTPRVRVVHLGSRKTVALLTAQVEAPFDACCFSADGKYLLARTGGMEQYVVVFHWVEERPVGMLRCKTPITRARFNPGSASLLSTSFPARLARLNDKGHFKEIEMAVLHKCPARADHCWLSAKVLLLADTNGSFWVVEDSALKQEMRLPACHTCTVESFSGGFVAGCHDGKVALFRRGDGGDYQPTIILNAPSPPGGAIHAIHIGPREENALLCGDEVYFFSLVDMLKLSELDQIDELRYSVLLSASHRGPVLSLSCAVSKPLLVSAGEDGMIRVWDFRSWTCQLCQMMPEPIVDASIHPDGMQLLVGYYDRVAIFHVSRTELLPWRELPVATLRAVRFAHGGHVFAAVTASSIHIFKSYSHQEVGLLASPTQITCFAWSPNDATLHFGAVDGMAHAWQLEGLRKVHEHKAGHGHVSGLGIFTDVVATDPSKQAAGRDHGSFLMAHLNLVAVCGEPVLRQQMSSDRIQEIAVEQHLSVVRPATRPPRQTDRVRREARLHPPCPLIGSRPSHAHPSPSLLPPRPRWDRSLRSRDPSSSCAAPPVGTSS